MSPDPETLDSRPSSAPTSAIRRTSEAAMPGEQSSPYPFSRTISNIVRSLEMHKAAVMAAFIAASGLFLGSAHAGPVGNYEYAEKGFRGKMNITEVSGCEFKDEVGCVSRRIYKITLVTVNLSNYHDCSVDALENDYARVFGGSFAEALFVTKPEPKEQPKSIVVRFDKNTAVVQLDKRSDTAGLCGLNGAFVGRWRRTSEPAAAPTGFIFTGDKAINAHNEKEFVRLFEKLPIAQLKKRFSRYRVQATTGEDCLVCAAISGKGGSIEVNYDENGLFVTGIFSYDEKSTDALGNSVGSSLQNAIGGRNARCDAGMWTSCASPRLPGLSYIVEDNENCRLSVSDQGKDTEIPACAKIAGFEIQKPR